MSVSHYFKIFFLLTCTQYITQNHFPQALSHERNMWRKEKCIQYDSSWRLNYSSIMRKCVINIIFPFCKKMKMSFLNLKVFYLLQSAKTSCRTWNIGFNFVAFSICLRIHFRLKMDIYNGETDSLLLSIGKLLLRLLTADIWILNTSKHINQQPISICIWSNILPDHSYWGKYVYHVLLILNSKYFKPIFKHHKNKQVVTDAKETFQAYSHVGLKMAHFPRFTLSKKRKWSNSIFLLQTRSVLSLLTDSRTKNFLFF